MYSNLCFQEEKSSSNVLGITRTQDSDGGNQQVVRSDYQPGLEKVQPSQQVFWIH